MKSPPGKKGSSKKNPLRANTKTLGENRELIDQLDDRILKLLNRRAEIVIRVGLLKKAKKADLYAPIREMEIYNRLSKQNKGPFPNKALRAIFREIISASLSLEGPLNVAYLGPEATFTHLACVQHFGNSALFTPVNSIAEVFSGVERGHADYGMIPIENSTEGVVSYTLDLFVDSPLQIVGEVMQEVSHHLMSKSGKFQNIKKIYSHPQALAQCRGWLEEHLPGVRLVEVSSTARAAEKCGKEKQAAAISSELAAGLYRLRIVRKRIEDNTHNFTRFLIVSTTGLPRSGRDKTSVLFSVRDRVGALHDMLKPFSEYGLNLTKIESRPSKKKAWEYIFFVDLEGHQEEAPVKEALERLQEHCLFLKVLGSYPAMEPRNKK